MSPARVVTLAAGAVVGTLTVVGFTIAGAMRVERRNQATIARIAKRGAR